MVTLPDSRVPKLKEVTFKYRISYIIYESIIIISNNINTADIYIFLGISIVDTTFPLNNYYLSNLIKFIVSISSITNRDAYIRKPYTFTTNGYPYIIRLNVTDQLGPLDSNERT